MALPAPDHLGKAERVGDAEGRYLEFCKGTFPKQRSLRGLKLVVDCAHGANYRVGIRIFQELGAVRELGRVEARLVELRSRIAAHFESEPEEPEQPLATAGD